MYTAQNPRQTSFVMVPFYPLSLANRVSTHLCLITTLPYMRGSGKWPPLCFPCIKSFLIRYGQEDVYCQTQQSNNSGWPHHDFNVALGTRFETSSFMKWNQILIRWMRTSLVPMCILGLRTLSHEPSLDMIASSELKLVPFIRVIYLQPLLDEEQKAWINDSRNVKLC